MKVFRVVKHHVTYSFKWFKNRAHTHVYVFMAHLENYKSKGGHRGFCYIILTFKQFQLQKICKK